MHKKPKHKDGYICLGVITGAHGIRGEVKLLSFSSEDPYRIGNYQETVTFEDVAVSILSLRGDTKKHLIAKLKNVTDRNAAEALKGTAIYAPREDAGEDLLIDDLIGMRVIHEDESEPFGKVIHAFDNGAHLVLEVTPDEGKKILIPFTEDAILDVNDDEGSITLTTFGHQFTTL